MQFLVNVKFVDGEEMAYVTEAGYASEAEEAVINCLVNEDGEDESNIDEVEAFPFDQFEHGDYRDYARV